MGHSRQWYVCGTAVYISTTTNGAPSQRTHLQPHLDVLERHLGVLHDPAGSDPHPQHSTCQADLGTLSPGVSTVWTESEGGAAPAVSQDIHGEVISACLSAKCSAAACMHPFGPGRAMVQVEP